MSPLHNFSVPFFLRFRKNRERLVNCKDNELKGDIDFHTKIQQQPLPNQDFFGISQTKSLQSRIPQNGIPQKRILQNGIIPQNGIAHDGIAANGIFHNGIPIKNRIPCE